MLTNERLLEYYESHKEDYPVVFAPMDHGIVMWSDVEGTNTLAYLEDNKAYEVYPSDEMPYVFIRSLKDDALAHHLEYDEDDPRLVLDVFVDCTYLQLIRVKNDVERLMNVIEGRN